MSERVESIWLAPAGPTRAAFDETVTESDLRQLAERPEVTTLQSSSPVSDQVALLLNETFFAVRPDVEFRIYGHYGTVCDLSFAKHLTNVRRFAADCLMQASDVEAIAAIPRLDALSLGIFELRDFRLLELMAPTLTTLHLGATRSAKPRLDALGRFTSLTTLWIEGHSHGLEVLADLHGLEELTLRSTTTSDLRYLAPLRRLWSLVITLGGIRSFAGIEDKDCIKYLELCRIRELKSADIVAALPTLQHLWLQDLAHLTGLPPLDRSVELRRVALLNLKAFADFTAFEALPSLEEFAFIQGQKQEPSQLVPVLRNPALRGANGHFGNKRKDTEFARLRDAHGKDAWDFGTPFVYR
jgi:hypothetical protein